MAPSDFSKADIPSIVEKLTLEESIALIAGVGFWKTHEVPRLGIPAIKVGLVNFSVAYTCSISFSSRSAMGLMGRDLIDKMNVLPDSSFLVFEGITSSWERLRSVFLYVLPFLNSTSAISILHLVCYCAWSHMGYKFD